MLRGLAASTAVPSMAIAGVFCLGALQGTLAHAQEAPRRATAAPLAFKVEWVRPVVKVDGTLLVGDVTFASVPKLGMHELSLTNVRWVKLDPTRVVTLNSGHGQGGYIQLGNIEVYAKTSPRTAPAK